MSADTCSGTGYIEFDGCDMLCNGCADCDFEWESQPEEDKTEVPF